MKQRWPLPAAVASAPPSCGSVALCSELAEDRCLSARGPSQPSTQLLPRTHDSWKQAGNPPRSHGARKPPTSHAAPSPQARFPLLTLAAPQNSNVRAGGTGRGDSRIGNQIKAASTSDSLSMTHTCQRPPNQMQSVPHTGRGWL